MKELWIEVDDSFPKDVRNSLLKLAKSLSRTVVVGRVSLPQAKALGLKTVSETASEVRTTPPEPLT